MKVSDVLHGFRLESIEEIPEMEAVAYRFTHLKSGADLLWLSADDENRAFSISFKTLPEDSTGVFHILEHSVLNGSEKFPLREPFVDLIKGSLQTFLNAMTFADKTMYPIASTNEKDFINLMDVYMDAVLHPLIYKKEEIFMQEGWHYEAAKDGKPSAFSGVVYNEMKGSLSSPDTVFYDAIAAHMFPDTLYSFNSGGDPKNIPDLTYEQFIATHKKFYSPENSYIYLYGKVNIEEALAFLDTNYLSAYTKQGIRFEIQKQAPIGDQTAYETYELGEGESKERNTYLGRSVMLCDFDDRKTQMGMRLLLDALTSSNAAPLKRAILDEKLGDEFSAWVDDGIYQPCVTFRLKKADASSKDRFLAVLTETLTKLADEGIDRDLLTATINQMDFELRERDTGMAPGVIYGISVMDSWLYGGNPTAPLKNRKILNEIRSEMENGYFENLIRKHLLSHEHALTLVLEPSETKAQERIAAEAKAVASYEAAIGEAGLAAWQEKAKLLNLYQTTEDTPEIKKMLPHLEREDLTRTYTPVHADVSEVSGVPHRFYRMATSGISYLKGYFDISEIPLSDMPYVSLLANGLFNLSTEDRDMFSYLNDVDKNLGSLSASLDGYQKFENREDYHPLLTFLCSYLEEKDTEAKRLLEEGLTRVVFRPEEVSEMIRQAKATEDSYIIRTGDSYASAHAMSRLSTAGLYDDAAKYVGYRDFLTDLCDHLDEKIDAVCEKLNSLLKTILTESAPCISFVGSSAGKEVYLAHPLSCVKAVKQAPSRVEHPTETASEAVKIPGSVVYDAVALDLAACGMPYSGVQLVLSKMLTYDYLWSEVRVKGGAYGTRASFSNNGFVSFTSYRDPHVGRTYDVFRSIPEFLKNFSADESEMTKYVIGAVSVLDSPLRPKTAAYLEDLRAFRGITAEDMRRFRSETIDATAEQIRAYAAPLAEAFGKSVRCTVGASEKIEAAKDLFDCVR